MSKESKDFRKDAAEHLRQSRNERSSAGKAREERLAAGYKELAHNEEWAGGERERSKPRGAKKKKK